MNQIEIIVDDREQAVIPYFNEHQFPPNISYKVSRITTGDYSILYKGHILFCIERKTWRDLAASIRDGRKHNVQKLLSMRESTGCQLIYLIEGTAIPKANAKFGRVPYKALRSHLDHLAFRDGIHMVYSSDLRNTVSRICELVQNFLTITPSPLLKFDDETTIDGGGVEMLKAQIPASAESVIYQIWQCVPNITIKTACLFINKGYHISDLILGIISKDEIYALKYDNGYVVGKRSTKIWNSTRLDGDDAVFIKMLSQINGITRATAAAIISSISFGDLLNNQVTVDQIADVVKSSVSGRKVGIKAAQEIMRCFIKNTSVVVE